MADFRRILYKLLYIRNSSALFIKGGWSALECIRIEGIYYFDEVHTLIIKDIILTFMLPASFLLLCLLSTVMYCCHLLPVAPNSENVNKLFFAF